MTLIAFSTCVLLGFLGQQVPAADSPDPQAAAIVASVEKLHRRCHRQGRAVGGGDQSIQERERSRDAGSSGSTAAQGTAPDVRPPVASRSLMPRA